MRHFVGLPPVRYLCTNRLNPLPEPIPAETSHPAETLYPGTLKYLWFTRVDRLSQSNRKPELHSPFLSEFRFWLAMRSALSIQVVS